MSDTVSAFLRQQTGRRRRDHRPSPPPTPTEPESEPSRTAPHEQHVRALPVRLGTHHIAVRGPVGITKAESSKPKKDSSDKLKRTLQAIADQWMANKKFHYEPAYFTRDLDDTDAEYMKLYVMNIGKPGDPNTEPAKSKTLTAYVGASSMPTCYRVSEHNNLSADYKNPKTRDGITRWTLCLVVFIPAAFRNKVTTKLPRDWWGLAHGIKGKLTRGFEFIRMFNLRYYVPVAHRNYIRRFEEANPLTDDNRNLFKPPAIIAAERASEESD